jgi:hypothetical protein
MQRHKPVNELNERRSSALQAQHDAAPFFTRRAARHE